jgi:transitional endoplasmic reticulum ATPase
VQFIVAKMPYGETDEGRALVSSDDLRRLCLEGSPVIAVTGRRRCTIRVEAGNVPSGRIALDGIGRANAESGLGETVTVTVSDAAPAVNMTVCLAQALPPQVQDSFSFDTLKRRLVGRVVSDGDLVGVRSFASRTVLRVMGIARKSPAMITPDTEIAFVPPEAELKSSIYTTYEDIGGLDTEVDRIREMVEIPLVHPELFDRFGIDPPRGLLLYGPPGTGKTLVARALSSQLRAHFIHVDGPEVMNKFYGEAERRLREIFAEAQRHAPSIVFFDELDALAPKRSQVIGDVEKRVVAQLLALMDGMSGRQRVMVVGASNMPELLDPALRRPGRFDREIYIGPPDEAGRRDILEIHTRNMPLAGDVDLALLSTMTQGYAGADLEVLCKEAGMSALRRAFPSMAGGALVEMADFLHALSVVRPASARALRFERASSSLTEIAGMDEIKARLSHVVRQGLGHALGEGAPSGTHVPSATTKSVLLHGPAGNGKSSLVRALAGEFGLNYLQVTPSLLPPTAQERFLEHLFQTARQSAPCILLFPDLDAMLSTGGLRAGDGSRQSLASQLSHEIENARTMPGFFVFATAQALGSVKVLAESCFQMIVEVGRPDVTTRLRLLKKGTQGMALHSSVDLESVAAGTEGLSSWQVLSICRQAAVWAAVEAQEPDGCRNDVCPQDAAGEARIAMRHFQQAMKEAK